MGGIGGRSLLDGLGCLRVDTTSVSLGVMVEGRHSLYEHGPWQHFQVGSAHSESYLHPGSSTMQCIDDSESNRLSLQSPGGVRIRGYITLFHYTSS